MRRRDPYESVPTVTEDEVNITVEERSNTVTLDVDGICCASEIPIVHKSLSDIGDGVHQIRVDVIGRCCTVEYDPLVRKPREFVDALNRSGLRAKIRLKTQAAMNKRAKGQGTDDVERTRCALPRYNVLAAAFCWLVAMLSVLDRRLGACEYAGLGSVALTIIPIVRRAYASVVRCLFDINLLLTLAVVGAIAMGAFVEAAAVVTLFSLSDWLEKRATDRARDAVKAIISLRPEVAVLEATGEEVDVECVGIGTRVVVRAGDAIPIDGVVVSGSSALDASNLTGESKPVPKKVSDAVSAGMINVGGGYLVIETTALSKDSAVAKLVELVALAHTQRSPTEKLVERFAKVYTPTIMVAAILLGTVPFIWSQEEGYAYLRLSTILLIIGCPCALVISTPITYVSALSQAARRGILVKGGKHLETLGRVQEVALDKTGTLTGGTFAIRDVRTLNGYSRTNLLRTLHDIESYSRHPIAFAACRYADKELHANGKVIDAGVRGSVATKQEEEGASKCQTSAIDKFERLDEGGIRAVVNGADVAVGNLRTLSHILEIATSRTSIEAAIGDSNVLRESEMWEKNGGTVVWMSSGGRIVGAVHATDAPRLEAREAIAMLSEMQIGTMMLTGDNDGSAASVQYATGVQQRRSNLLPVQKVDEIRLLKLPSIIDGGSTTVAMVGDGVNDAPALALADVGIAMGVTGTVVAMETADVCLMDNDLRKIAEIIALGRKTIRKIRENVTIAVVSKAVVLLLAFSGWAPYLWFAILADVGAMLVVTMNGLTMLEKKKSDIVCVVKEYDVSVRRIPRVRYILMETDGARGLTICPIGKSQSALLFPLCFKRNSKRAENRIRAGETNNKKTRTKDQDDNASGHCF
eukprot:g1357.t1